MHAVKCLGSPKVQVEPYEQLKSSGGKNFKYPKIHNYAMMPNIKHFEEDFQRSRYYVPNFIVIGASPVGVLSGGYGLMDGESRSIPSTVWLSNSVIAQQYHQAINCGNLAVVPWILSLSREQEVRLSPLTVYLSGSLIWYIEYKASQTQCSASSIGIPWSLPINTLNRDS